MSVACEKELVDFGNTAGSVPRALTDPIDFVAQ